MMNSRISWGLMAGILALPAFSTAQWSDNFDSYTAGTDVINQGGGWKGWNNSSTNGSMVVDTQALSAPNSLQSVGIGDTVHEYSGITSGQWMYTADVYVPTNFTVSGETAWFILLSDYADNGSDHWSVQLQMTGDGQVTDASSNGGNVTPTTLIRGQWVPIEVDFNLDANTRVVKYNGVQVSDGTWTDGLSGSTMNLGAVDLFANSPDDVSGGNTVPVYYDNMAVAPVPEPATLSCLALGVLTLIRKRRK